MKKSIFKLAALLLTTLSITSCKKDALTYEDKLTGEWHSVTVKLNDADVTDFFTYEIELEGDNEFNARFKTVKPLTGKSDTTYPHGTWSADESSEIFELKYAETDESESYKVLELTEDAMTVEVKQGEDVIEIKFERVE